jgi:hypothetical protein
MLSVITIFDAYSEYRSGVMEISNKINIILTSEFEFKKTTQLIRLRIA